MKTLQITKFIAPAVIAVCLPHLCAQEEKPVEAEQAAKPVTMKVEVLEYPVVNVKALDPPKGVDKTAKKTVELFYVTYNLDRSQFVGYYQDGWMEMVSLHDAKTKKQVGYVYCEGGAPDVFRFSRDGKHLGAKANVGWYVWKIPSFEEVLILGRTNFYELEKD